MSIIEDLDFFGSQFHFSVNHRQRYYSKIGGILSLISVIIMGVVFYVMSISYFHRSNRKEVALSFYAGYKKMKFGQEKVWIPWRFADYSGNPVNFTNVFYPRIFYYYGERQKDTDLMQYNSIELKYKKCTETDFDKQNYQLNIDLNTLYCIEMEDLYMGGDYSFEDYVYQIEVNVYLCKNGESYDESNPNCTSYDELIKHIGVDNAWNFAIFYPDVEFHPESINKPFIVSYRSKYYHLSFYSSKIERLYLQEFILYDDLGWIAKREKKISYWGMERISSDDYSINRLYNKKDIVGGISTSRLYSWNIFLSPFVKHYYRSYTKLFEMISEVFPVLSFIFTIFSYLANKIKLADLQTNHLNYMFNYEEQTLDDSKIKGSIINNSKLNDIKNQGGSSSLNFNNFNNLNLNFKPKKLSERIITNKFNSNNNSNNNLNEISCKTHHNESNIIRYNTFLHCNIRIRKKDFDDFKYSYLISEICAYRFKRCLTKSFFVLSDFLNSLYDIKIYLKFIKEFTLLKNLVLPNDILSLIESHKKLAIKNNYLLPKEMVNDIINDKLNTLLYIHKT